MPRIRYTDANGNVREKVFSGRLRLGRHPSQDIQILDRVVSKEHAVIEARDDGVYVWDAGSRNGTQRNGRTIDGTERLDDGDEIRIGSTTLTLVGEPAPVATTPEAGRKDTGKTRVTILDDAMGSAIRKRLRETGNHHFLSAELIDDLEQLRRDYEKLRIANELNRAVALEFDLDRLLNRILEKAFEMFAADRGVILLLDEASGELTPAATRARFEQMAAGGHIRISRTILREVIDEKTAVLSSDAQMDSRFGGAHSIIMAGIRSTMSVPLMYRERLLGVIHLDSQLAAGAFTEKDLGLLTGFASQAANAIEHSRLVERTKNEALAREQLGRLLPQHLVDDVMEGRVDVKRGGDTREATVLFADIRGFTAMSERYDAQAIVGMLNNYFEVMVDVIFRHGGTLDKFVGDEIMAVWGAPIAAGDHCIRAVQAAIEMQRALEAFNRERVAAGDEPVLMGIGINTGEMVAGYMGSSKAMDYTVIGDTVNTGSRLCSAASPGDIIVSESVIRVVHRVVRWERLEARELKGKREPVPLYRVLGEAG